MPETIFEQSLGLTTLPAAPYLAPDIFPAARACWLDQSAGRRVRLACWAPQEGDGNSARGVCLLFQGRAEFVEKYAEVASELTARGFYVLAPDWPGQALSTPVAATHPQRGHLNDIGECVAVMRTLEPRLAAVAVPRVVLAHSMGGNIALRWLGETRLEVAAAGLVSPMSGINVGPLPQGLAAMFASLACRLGFAEAYAPGQHDSDPAADAFDANVVTSDRDRYERARSLLLAHTALRTGGVTWGWLEAAFRSMAAVRKRAPEAPRLPLHIFSAPADRVVPAGTHTALAALLKAGLSHHPGEHELLMEKDAIRADVLAGFDALLARAGI
ncbi:alpha/beta fold hydrolase [Radicibacter daui]|uniref:alpha/beta fold hydrolase n=1 Tax=Radicibacter daui TaxID=3064829 RepID=UPI004046A337